MDFYSSYAQGFARVAACTRPIVAVDPERNADGVIEQVRDLHDDGVAVAIFPELSETFFLPDIPSGLLKAGEGKVVLSAANTFTA